MIPTVWTMTKANRNITDLERPVDTTYFYPKVEMISYMKANNLSVSVHSVGSVLVGLSVLLRPHSHTSSQCTDNTSPYGRMRTFCSLRVAFRTIHPMRMHWLEMFERFCFFCLKSSQSRTMSLLVPDLSSSDTTPTRLTGIRLNSCATPLGLWPIRFQTQVMSPCSAWTSVERAYADQPCVQKEQTRQSPLQRILTFLYIHEQAATGIWNGKRNKPFEEKTQLRKDFPKLKQK